MSDNDTSPIRGGSWNIQDPQKTWSSFDKYGMTAIYRTSSTGFRTALAGKGAKT